MDDSNNSADYNDGSVSSESRNDSNNSEDSNDGLVVHNETADPKATATGMELDMNEGDLEAKGSGNVSEADNNDCLVVCNETTDPIRCQMAQMLPLAQKQRKIHVSEIIAIFWWE